MIKRFSVIALLLSCGFASIAGAAEHAESVGLPHLNTATYISQIFWLFVAFALIYTLMSKLSLPRVAKVLAARQALREGNLAKASELQEDAEKTKVSYEAALAKAQTAAQASLIATEQEISEKIAAESARFAEQSRKRIAMAEQNIAKAKADAVNSLTDISAEIAAEIVGKIADVQMSKTDAKKAVESVMQKGAA